MGLRLRRALELYTYFPFGIASRMALLEALGALLIRHRQCSWADAGEDRIIASYLGLGTPGFYVDVGCNHPFISSNTAYLYSRGWRGVAVDGNPEVIRLFRRLRPRDCAVCAVVSNQSQSVDFCINRNSAFSAIAPAHGKDQLGDAGNAVGECVRVGTVPLQAIMEGSGVPPVFGLLSVDVEGHEFEVLSSFDLGAFRPRVVVVEMHGFRPDQPGPDRVYRYLERNHYSLRS
jgi:FkbM family methyltransferase